MTARVLIVDDVPSNIRLLEARLMAEYFQVLTASNGKEALKICQAGNCDLVLLDVMMPEMDGFEVCQRLKSDPATMHIPVVIVTALDSDEDRLRGLEAGADDFLKKPVNDLALVTRVKSLSRLKMTTDELRLRAQDGEELSIENFANLDSLRDAAATGKIVIVDDKVDDSAGFVSQLSQTYEIDLLIQPHEALVQIASSEYDLALVSLELEGQDSLRLCSHLRTIENTRNLPIIGIANPGQEDIVSRAMDIGVNDYVKRPIDVTELSARMRTQLLRKRYNDCLRNSVQQTIEMAVKDALTGMHNRRYFDSQFQAQFDKARSSGAEFSVVMCDIDHFKRVNDTHGHDVGDVIIQECAKRIMTSIRSTDTACRYGGEEFVILMPGTSDEMAQHVCERIRETICDEPAGKNGANGNEVTVTMSFGVSTLENREYDTPEKLLKRADLALYSAKRDGRNRVAMLAA